MFGALALDQEYWKERINAFIALAPVIIPNNESKFY